jgi:hypothetical protein
MGAGTCARLCATHGRGMRRTASVGTAFCPSARRVDKGPASMGYAPYGKKMEKRYLRLKMILEKFYISYSLCFLNVDVPI